jgi:hypothetical protein
MVLRSSGKTGVRAATFKIGSRAVRLASALIVGGAKVFCWLSASRSITQKEVAVAGQLWIAAPSSDGSIEGQWAISPAFGLPI